MGGGILNFKRLVFCRKLKFMRLTFIQYPQPQVKFKNYFSSCDWSQINPYNTVISHKYAIEAPKYSIEDTRHLCNLNPRKPLENIH